MSQNLIVTSFKYVLNCFMRTKVLPHLETAGVAATSSTGVNGKAADSVRKATAALSLDS